MKYLKALLLALFSSTLISFFIVLSIAFIENKRIKSDIKMHFYESDCLSSGFYATNLMFGYGFNVFMKVYRVNPKSFKVIIYKIEYYFKDKNKDIVRTDYYDQQREILGKKILNELLVNCEFNLSELEYIFKLGSLEMYSTYDYMLDDYKMPRYRLFYLTQTYFPLPEEYSYSSNIFRVDVFEYNTYSEYKLDTESFIVMLIIITGGFLVIVSPFLIMRIRKKPNLL